MGEVRMGSSGMKPGPLGKTPGSREPRACTAANITPKLGREGPSCAAAVAQEARLRGKGSTQTPLPAPGARWLPRGGRPAPGPFL